MDHFRQSSRGLDCSEENTTIGLGWPLVPVEVSLYGNW